MSIGERILSEIIKQQMFVIATPDPEVSHVFVWSSGAAEQLEALVNEAYLERVGAIGPFENPDSQKPLEPAETWLQERANWMIAIKLLESERDQLRAALAAAKEDTERLIEAATACVEQIKHIEYLRQINGGPVPATLSGEIMANAQAAIDAARKAQP